MVEALDAQKLRLKTEEFARIGPREGVNNFVVRGRVRDLKVEPEAFVCLFAHFRIPGEPVVMVLQADPEAKGPSYYYSEILDLEIPIRVEKYGIRDSLREKKNMISKVGLKGMPYIALLFGHYLEKGKKAGEVAILNSIVGLSPETALAELKIAAEGRLASFQ